LITEGSIKTPEQIVSMKHACKIVAEALIQAESRLVVGATTRDVDDFLRQFIENEGAKPAFLGLYGFPATACISINEEIVHGIPGERKLAEGDLVSIDCGAIIDGMYSDHARTFLVGEKKEEDKLKLISVAKKALDLGIENSYAGNKIGMISNSIENYVLGEGFDVVREYVGHGIGTQLHEPPSVPNFGDKDKGALLRVGMAIAIEPMVTQGTWETKVLNDKWTVVTKDGKLSTHVEDTVLITENGPEVLTRLK
tara:strand:- start:2594 stop:3355 length:762 start_codon:yes stop_codon:yes gene_type:complete